MTVCATFKSDRYFQKKLELANGLQTYFTTASSVLYNILSKVKTGVIKMLYTALNYIVTCLLLF